MDSETIRSVASLISSIAAVLGLAITILVFAVQQNRQNKLQRLNIYQNIEFESNQVFRFEAVHSEFIDPYMLPDKPDDMPEMTTSYIDNYFYQVLNLFEIASAHRRRNMIDSSVYGSWVHWNYAILKSWYFREEWEDSRLHYTNDVRHIFDIPVLKFSSYDDDKTRKQAFYEHVSRTMNCGDTATWLTDCAMGPARRIDPPMTRIDITWATTREDVLAASAFFYREVTKHDDYISSGEVKFGLSSDCATWDADVAETFRQDFLATLDARSDAHVLIARAADGEIAGVLCFHEATSRKIPYLSVDDVIIAESHMRQGVGDALVSFVEAHAKANGFTWVFLEIGVRNDRSRQFFENREYSPRSQIYGKIIE